MASRSWLGRESAVRETIMDRYRELMRNNHPDMGGSAFICSKVNEAKELLIKEARSDPAAARAAKAREDKRKERMTKRAQREEDATAPKDGDTSANSAPERPVVT